MSGYILWIDVINKALQGRKNKNLQAFNDDGWLSARNREYKHALKVCHNFRRYNRGSFLLIGRQMWISEREALRFARFFKRYFKSRKPEMSKRRTREKISRPKHHALESGDRRITERFYLRAGVDLNRLTRNEYKEFVECKDVIHESIYGKVERFNKLNHGYIDGDERKKKQFMKDLKQMYGRIMADREKNKTVRRYVREVYV
jgi:hypothetical protein